MEKAHNDFAWLLATSPDASARDSNKAIKHATAACKMTGWSNDAYLDTLAAAYASASDFDEAITWQNKALANAADNYVKEEYKARLRLYQSGTPYIATKEET